MKNPKNKGNTFERQISETLSLWLTNGEQKRACWRSDTSGASATFWTKKGEEASYVQANAGDIRQLADKKAYPTLDKFFETFVVECKSYNKIDFYPPFNKTLLNWFDQLLKEKNSTGKKALLIAKANNRKVLFCSETIQPDKTVQLIIKHKELSLYCYLLDDMISTPFELPS